MSFINVTISSVRTFRTISVSAGPDTYTFCPSVISLIGEAFGNTAGSTFRWEQVLPYQYVITNRSSRELSVSGDLVASSTGIRELVSFVVNESVVFVTQIESMTVVGGTTHVTVTDPIPNTVPTDGRLLHAGSATDSSFSWDAGQNTLSAVITPIVTSDKRFRLWSNRGQAHQRYDDVDVILTPRDIVLGVSGASATTVIEYLACRTPAYQVISDSPYPPFSCGSGGTLVSNMWAVRWVPPTCDVSLLAGYVVQQSCDGGDTWVTLATTDVPYDVSFDAQCMVRIGALYSSEGTFRGVDPRPTAENVDFVFTQPFFAPTSGSTIPIIAGYDSVCITSGTAVVDPITAIEVTRLVMATLDAPNDSVHVSPVPLNNPEQISLFEVTRLVLGYLDGGEDVVTLAPADTTTNPISSFTVVGSGTIGG